MAVSAQQASDDYFDNAGYEASGSVAECSAFITACIRIIGLASKASERGQGTSAEHEFDIPTIREELVYARNWKQANGGNAAANGGAGSCSGGVRITEVDFRPGAGRN